MKVMLTSDLHGRLDGFEEAASNADVVAVAGDFAQLKGRGSWHIYDQKKWVQKKFIPILEKLCDVQFVIVPGNHDFCVEPTRCRSMSANGQDMHLDWPENVHFLLDSSCEIDGFKFYGTPWVPPISWSWAFESDLQRLKEKFSNIPEGLDFLITHCPPFLGRECDVDRSIQTDSEHFGSYALAEEILAKKPSYAICGHIHSGDHTGHLFGDTMVFNVSRLDERYDIAYEPLWLDLKDKHD